MIKYPRPKEQSPSEPLIRHIDHNRILKELPIVDVACGYGRNGAYFVNKGYEVFFVDIDQEALSFIQQGTGVAENGECISGKYHTIREDLRESCLS